MTTVNIYLSYNGDCEEAFNFYKSVFGGDFQYLGRYKDMPPTDDCPAVTGEAGEKIMHVSLPISTETVLMGSDVGGQWTDKFNAGNNFSVSISCDSKEESDRLFNELSAGGQVSMPMNSTFWGDYFGMLVDKFGISWMVSFAENPQK